MLVATTDANATQRESGENIGAVAYFKTVDVVPALPKTRSGKILRKTMRSIVDGQPYQVPSTIDDPAILDELQHAVQARSRPEPPR